MWGKRMLCLSIVVALIGVGSGCSTRSEQRKIVLKEDVRQQEMPQRVKVGVEQINIDLKEGEYFYPAFYLEGEVYGSVGEGQGTVNFGEALEYPVEGIWKPYLYKLDRENEIDVTTKRVLTNTYAKRMMTYHYVPEVGSQGALVEIDYQKEDEPRVMSRLCKKLGTIDQYGDLFITPYQVKSGQEVLVITQFDRIAGQDVLCFYDVKEDKLYTSDEIRPRGDHIRYLPALESFICIDQDYKCYRVVFEKDTFRYEEYLDFTPYISDGEKKGKLSVSVVDNEEIILHEERILREDGYFKYHPLYETNQFGSFNFRTNQYTQLIKVKQNEHMNMSVVAGVKASAGKVIFVVDRFEIVDGNMLPQYRELCVINDGQLVSVFREDIQAEGATLSPYVQTVVSEDGKQIFLKKERTTMEHGSETTQGVTYKRYYFQ